MNNGACCALALAATACATSEHPRVSVGQVESCEGAQSASALCQEIVVAAPRADVWRLFSTSEGLRTWVAPMVKLDLRIGGVWEASYDPLAQPGDRANIQNRVLSFAPERMLSIQVDRAPPDFEHEDLARQTWSVIELDDAGPGLTRVRVLGLGYGQGGGFDELRVFFERGNAWTLRQLHARTTNGPIHWPARESTQRETDQ